VELYELQVEQLGAGLEGHRETVAGGLPGVGGDLEDLAPATGGHHHRLGLEDHKPSVLATVTEGSTDPTL